jgi:hypothetical protein
MGATCVIRIVAYESHNSPLRAKSIIVSGYETDLKVHKCYGFKDLGNRTLLSQRVGIAQDLEHRTAQILQA